MKSKGARRVLSTTIELCPVSVTPLLVLANGYRR